MTLDSPIKFQPMTILNLIILEKFNTICISISQCNNHNLIKFNWQPNITCINFELNPIQIKNEKKVSNQTPNKVWGVNWSVF